MSPIGKLDLLNNIDSESLFGDVITTKNSCGVCCLKPPKPLEKFLDGLKPGMHLLDIGSGYGTACTIPALEMGLSVDALDMNAEHLSILRNICFKLGYKVNTIQAHFPNVELEEKSYDAIVACSALHYLDFELIIQSLAKIKSLLKDHGEFFILTSTPYMQLFEAFLPVYLENKKKGIKPAGLITQSSQYIKNPIFKSPEQLTLFDKEELEELLNAAGFRIKECSYSSMSPISCYLKEEKYGGIVYSICSRQ